MTNAATSYEVAFFVREIKNIIRHVYDSYDIDLESAYPRDDICLVNKIFN